jgi:hypothetical protein
MPSNSMNIIQYTFQSLYGEVLYIMPKIILAIIILAVGFFIASLLKQVVRKIFKVLHVDEALTTAGVHTMVERAGYKLNSGYFVGALVKWFVVLVFFLAALEVLQLQQVSYFLSEVVLGYLPKVIVATLILFGGIIIASTVQGVVTAAARTAHFKAPEFLGRFARYAVLTFVVLAVLTQLGIAAELAQMLFAGMVFALALAFGLAFGLGGKDAASRAIASMTDNR